MGGTWPTTATPVAIKKRNVDVWETIDDWTFTGAIPPIKPSQWPDTTQCGGTESTPGDDNVWKDVTTTNGTTASTCTATPANCTMQDKITGLWWSKSVSSQISWENAWTQCKTTHNNPGGYNGQTGWRLPTQKELMEAYTHDIGSAASSNWIPESGGAGGIYSNFWSGSTDSTATANAWSMNLSSGLTNKSGKGDTRSVVCVR